MSYWNQAKPYTRDKAIIAFADDISTPHSLTLTSTYLSVDADNRKALPAGMFVAKVGNVNRFLPRATVSAAFSTGAATGTVSTPANVFIPGDVLYIPTPFASFTIAGTWAAIDTVTVTVGGKALVVTAGSTVTATIAATVAAAINASAQLGSLVFAIASGSVVYIFSGNGVTPYTIATATSGSGTVAITGSATALAQNNTAVGTVLSVNATTGVITLTGNAGIAVPIGAPVGVLVNDIYGVYPHSIDFTDQPSKEIAPVRSCRGVYKDALPYFDSTIAAVLSNIPFYSIF